MTRTAGFGTIREDSKAFHRGLRCNTAQTSCLSRFPVYFLYFA
ncbi:hypothetical protein RMSM_00287 [Rhodopirellula maiorica SM1]|uniref:Uncharacterized protein n=1 Tax=Rhodopirellula maiorica SM1 TaxID=1265738 RepID=M5S584_9BACT|nr:hypothetical protein RMSM_00287 [Rhodopirellula maiorica SM1]